MVQCSFSLKIIFSGGIVTPYFVGQNIKIGTGRLQYSRNVFIFNSVVLVWCFSTGACVIN